MKKTNILYWVFTALFAALMLFSAIPDIQQTDQTVLFMTLLGYPDYFTPFIGIAKVLGVIALFIPGYPRVKEWAYAGLFFDLIGAVYSMLYKIGFEAGLLFMILPIGTGIASYIYYHKRLKSKELVMNRVKL